MVTPADAPDRTAVIAQDWLPGYELLSEIGAGGFGTVYKARQLKLDRLVAVKLIKRDLMADPDQAARFETEAVILGKFRHPNIVHVYDLGSHGGRLYLAEELLEGEDLGVLLKRTGRLDERTAWHVARQAAAGLAHAASHRVVHRDVKPANLFLTPPPTGVDWPIGIPLVQIMDFGIARVKWAVDADGFPRTHQGAIVGTPAYMAPEQHQGIEDLDHRADIYSLGVTLYHALTGHPPFSAKTVWEMMARKLSVTPTMWDCLSPASAELIRSMIAPDRADRIQTYEELSQRIDAVLSDRKIANVAGGIRGTRGKVRMQIAGIVAVIIGIGIGVWFGVRPAVRAALPATYVSSGDQQALFTGKPDVYDWRAPEAGGNWTVEKDDEKTPVLCGTGFTRRAYQAPAENRITLGLDLYRATVAEVHFGIPVRASESMPRYVLRITRAGGAVLGTRVGSRGEFTPGSEPIPFPPESWFQDRRPYLEVKIDRTAGGWAVWFNGKLVGRAAYAADTADEFRLFADGGKARIDSAILEPIRKR
ncbi:MAG TPA: serine/threonine-protein kinase [Fimbriiglobus sp.]|jgi:hypothetical protein